MAKSTNCIHQWAAILFSCLIWNIQISLLEVANWIQLMKPMKSKPRSGLSCLLCLTKLAWSKSSTLEGLCWEFSTANCWSRLPGLNMHVPWSFYICILRHPYNMPVHYSATESTGTLSKGYTRYCHSPWKWRWSQLSCLGKSVFMTQRSLAAEGCRSTTSYSKETIMTNFTKDLVQTWSA